MELQGKQSIQAERIIRIAAAMADAMACRACIQQVVEFQRHAQARGKLPAHVYIPAHMGRSGTMPLPHLRGRVSIVPGGKMLCGITKDGGGQWAPVLPTAAGNRDAGF